MHDNEDSIAVVYRSPWPGHNISGRLSILTQKCSIWTCPRSLTHVDFCVPIFEISLWYLRISTKVNEWKLLADPIDLEIFALAIELVLGGPGREVFRDKLSAYTNKIKGQN